MIKNILLTISVMVFGVVSMPAQAGSADWKTSAEECACDQLRDDGVTKSLYGHCRDYSKALKKMAKYEEKALEKMGTDEKKAAKYEKKMAKYEKKADKAMAKYNGKMNDGDPAMPCGYTTGPGDTTDPGGTGAAVCPCFNTQVCEDTAAVVGGTCGIANVETVADVFIQESCSLADMCMNTTTSATNACANLASSSGANVTIYENEGYGTCSATLNAGRNEILHLDLATAQLCLQELNQFDPEADSNTAMTMSCGLATP